MNKDKQTKYTELCHEFNNVIIFNIVMLDGSVAKALDSGT